MISSYRIIERISTNVGLKNEHLEALVHVICSCRFPSKMNNKLIRHLIPANLIPEHVIIRIISFIGVRNKAGLTTKTTFWRWIALIYDLIDTKSTLSCLYELIFHYLQYDCMCPSVAFILYNMTRKEHVKYFRVMRLIELQKKLVSQKPLKVLLGLYKQFKPHLVHLPDIKSDENFFKKCDKAWNKTIKQVANKHTHLADLLLQPIPELEVIRIAQVKQKRKRKCIIPEKSVKLRINEKEEMVSFEQIKTFEEFLQQFENIELPGQIVTILRRPPLQRLVSCCSDKQVVARFSYSLKAILFSEFINDPPETVTPESEQLLEMLVSFSDYLQEGIPVCDEFLMKYLYLWNGKDYRINILQLITRMRICPFDELNSFILEPLKKLFLTSSVYVKCQLMDCFTKFLHNLAFIEIPKYCFHAQINETEDGTKIPWLFLFSENVPDIQPLHILKNFVDFVKNMCSLGLLQEDYHSLFIHCMLSFFEIVATLESDYFIHFVDFLPSSLFYKILFSDDASAITRLCQLMISYKDSIEKLRQVFLTEKLSKDAVKIMKIGHFNLCIMDICESLWRCNSFQQKSKLNHIMSLEKSLIEELDCSDINECFGIHRNSAFIGFAYNYLQEQLPKGAKLSLVKASKRKYLEYLSSNGMTGLNNFINTFIKQKQL